MVGLADEAVAGETARALPLKVAMWTSPAPVSAYMARLTPRWTAGVGVVERGLPVAAAVDDGVGARKPPEADVEADEEGCGVDCRIPDVQVPAVADRGHAGAVGGEGDYVWGPLDVQPMLDACC